MSTTAFSDVSPWSSGDVDDGSVTRRSLLALSLGSVAFASGWKWHTDSAQFPPASASESSNRQVLVSVDEALALIDSQCDRRFLHALVATDYQQLLYRGVPSVQDSQQPAVVRVNSVSQMAPVTTDFRQALMSPSASMVEDFAGSTPFHLTTVNRKAVGSNAMALWPLGENVHFAWPEQEDDRLWSQRGGSLVLNPSMSIVVDGVDCGVMSLEDALERPTGQVMVHANAFLLVPKSMQPDLIARLKESFII
jgi:hypothetical protein